MIRMGRKTLLAIDAVLDIAHHAGDGPVQSAEITDRLGVPRRYLEPVLQGLVRADILTGVRGPRGGYRLARERRRISIGDIVRVASVVEGAADPGEPVTDGSALSRAVVRPLWTALQDTFMRQLDAQSIEDLCARARDAGIVSAAAQRLDFNI